MLVSGKVIDTEILIDAGDAGPEGTKLKKGIFTATLQAEGNGVSKKFRIFTEPEQAEILLKRERYMAKEKSYRFCAREDIGRLPKKPEMDRYIIDSIENIKEIK